MAALNHPQKGSRIKVDPIKDMKHIKSIKKLLAGQRRNFAIFTVGININLRASDLLKLTVGDLKYIEVGKNFEIREKKTKKTRNITINKNVHTAIQNLLATMPDATDSDFLFQSRKGGGALTVPTLNALVKNWTAMINLRGNYGSHTLRKTFGYIHRTVFNTDIPTLMDMFNHSNQKQTLDYLCIQPDEIKNAYMCEI
jgi:integrase